MTASTCPGVVDACWRSTLVQMDGCCVGLFDAVVGEPAAHLDAVDFDAVDFDDARVMRAGR